MHNPTSPIEFKATLGETRETHYWYLAASRAASREKVTVQLTGEEVANILRLDNVRAALKECFGVTFKADAEAHFKETIVQLTERVAELQRVCDAHQRPGALGDHDAKCQLEIWGMFDKEMSFGQIRDEIARLLKHDKNIQRVSTEPGHVTKFDEALTMALREPTLADALSLMATWDNERAIRQALRNAGPDNREEGGDGGLWTTTFKYCFTRVLDVWPELSLARLRLRRRSRIAESLWQLLDDIDSSSDSIKPDEIIGFRLFYRRVLAIAERRHAFLKSDGNKLTWPDGEAIERKARDTFEEMPEHDPAIYAKYADLKFTVDRALRGEQFMAQFPGNADLGRQIAKVRQEPQAPIPMLLFCPMCHTKHIDEGEFATRAHHSHACQGHVTDDGVRRHCGHVWRPALVPTVGVEALPGFINA